MTLTNLLQSRFVLIFDVPGFMAFKADTTSVYAIFSFRA